jgi:RNA polymerase sigma-70 factor (ECF subfamily)
MNKATKIQAKCQVQLKVVQGAKSEKNAGKSRVNETITDVMLVERAVAGDGIAFSELVNRHYEKAVRVAFGMLKDIQDAEDVAQDAFARVHRKLEGFQGQSAFSTWLYRIVVNLSIDLMRKKKRQRRADIDDEAARDALRSEQDLWPRFEEHDPSVSFERRELHKQLNEAFAELPDIHRAVLVLREVQGLSYDEIAQALDIKKGTVMSRLFHARKAMQVQMTNMQKAQAEGGVRR